MIQKVILLQRLLIKEAQQAFNQDGTGVESVCCEPAYHRLVRNKHTHPAGCSFKGPNGLSKWSRWTQTVATTEVDFLCLCLTAHRQAQRTWSRCG